MKANSKQVVIYGRVSSKDKGQEYARQISELLEYATLHKWEVLDVFHEKESGTIAGEDRSQFKRMLDFVTDNKIDCIMVWEQSRLGRDSIEIQQRLKQFGKQGISVFIKNRNIKTLDEAGQVDKNAKFYTALQSIIDEKELDTLKERIISGLRYSVSQKGAGTGKIKPYGFENVNKKLVINKEEAKIVVDIFNKYANGMGTTQLSNYLNSKGIPTKYQKTFKNQSIKFKSGFNKKAEAFQWTSTTIIGILKNTLYKGERKWGKDKEVFHIEQIVDPILFDKVQLILKKRSNRPVRLIKNDNYLRGIIHCTKCGQPYTMHKRKPDKKGIIKDNAYYCMSNKLKYEGKAISCGSPGIGIDKLLDTLYITTTKLVLENLKIKKITSISDLENSINIKKTEIQTIKNAIMKISKKENSLIDLYTDGSINKIQFKTKQEEYKQDSKDLKEKYDSLIVDLQQFEKASKSPVTSGLNKQLFLSSIKDVILNIRISRYEDTGNKFRKDKYAKKPGVKILVEVDAINNIKYKYALSRYTDEIVVFHGKSTVKFNYKNSVKNVPLMTHPYFQILANTLDELVKKKIKKAA